MVIKLIRIKPNLSCPSIRPAATAAVSWDAGAAEPGLSRGTAVFAENRFRRVHATGCTNAWVSAARDIRHYRRWTCQVICSSCSHACVINKYVYTGIYIDSRSTESRADHDQQGIGSNLNKNPVEQTSLYNLYVRDVYTCLLLFFSYSVRHNETMATCSLLERVYRVLFDFDLPKRRAAAVVPSSSHVVL